MIDFDNSDLGIIGIVLIICCLIITAAFSSHVSLSQILPFSEKLLLVLASLITPGGLAKAVKRGQELKNTKECD